MLDENQVLITDEEGVIQEIITAENAGDDVQHFNGILSPGFINCHCHLELSHMKGLIPEKTGLVDFVFKVVTQRHFQVEEILNAIAVAEEEMLQSGIVAVGDICNNELTIPQKLKHKVHYQNFIEVAGWHPAVAETRMERSRKIYDAFTAAFPSTSLVPHAPYSVSEDLWQKMKPFFKDQIVSIHNQETTFEDQFFKSAEGDFVRMYQMMKIDNSFFQPTKKSSLQTYFEKLQTASSLILVHNTFTKEEDVQFAMRSVTSKPETQNPKLETSNLPHPTLHWCLCINANLYIENAVPPVEIFKANDCNMVIGTDSLASNHSLNILEELKSLRQHFPSISLEEMLQWATSNGANALEINDKYGHFATGKKPGIVVIKNLDNNHLSPRSVSQRIL